MIVDEEKQKIINSHDFEESDFGIDKEDIPFVMNILRNQIYSDKILAVVREYTTNAIDAHIDAGIPDKPIRITVPSLITNHFAVRDFGTGLTHDQIKDLYIKYCKSTKRQSNDFTGQLGIGCKSGFAYSDSFTIVSYIDGKKNIYNACIDDKNRGKVLLMASEETDEETGIEIIIPVEERDKDSFVDRVKRISPFFSVKPEIVNLSDQSFLNTIEENAKTKGTSWKIMDSDFTSSSDGAFDYFEGHAIAVMGNIPYKIDLEIAKEHADRQGIDIYKPGYYDFVVIDFDIGDLAISSSRENLEYTDKTIESTVAKLKTINDEIIASLAKRFDNCTNRAEVIQTYNSLNNNYSDISMSKVMALTKFAKKKHHYFQSRLYVNENRKTTCDIFQFTRSPYSSSTAKEFADSKKPLFKEDVESIVYSNSHVSSVDIEEGNVIIFDDVYYNQTQTNSTSLSLKKRLFTFLAENEKVKNIFLVRRIVKTNPQQFYKKFKERDIFEDCSDNFFQNLSDFDEVKVEEPQKITRNVISRADCDLFKLADVRSDTFNENWKDLDPKNKPTEGIYVPMSRFNINWKNCWEFSSIGYELIKIKSLLSDLQIDFPIYGLRKKDVKNLDKKKWKSLYDWMEEDFLDILIDNNVMDIHFYDQESMELREIFEDSRINYILNEEFIDKIHNHENPIYKTYQEFKEINKNIDECKFNYSDTNYFCRIRDAILKVDGRDSDTLSQALKGYISTYEFRKLLTNLEESYPLLQYIKYSYNQEKFADYINLLDVLNPPV